MSRFQTFFFFFRLRLDSLICPEGISTSGNAQFVRNSPESFPSGKGLAHGGDVICV